MTNSKLFILSNLNNWKTKFVEINKLMNSRYGDALVRAYEDLDLSVLYMSSIHGVGHIERTMLLGALIAQNEELNERDTWMLLQCCAYHDTGRIDDSRDPCHGKRSADKMLESPIKQKLAGANSEEALIMRAAVAAHSVSDKNIQSIIMQFEVEDVEHFKVITSCLKDADNLDRVRLGDLDPGHLRHKKTIELIPFAESIFHRYYIK